MLRGEKGTECERLCLKHGSYALEMKQVSDDMLELQRNGDRSVED